MNSNIKLQTKQLLQTILDGLDNSDEVIEIETRLREKIKTELLKEASSFNVPQAFLPENQRIAESVRFCLRKIADNF